MSKVMQVPKGWTVTNFGAIAKINMGQSPDSNYVNEEREGIPFLQGNAEFCELHPEEVYWVTEPKKLAANNDILMSVRAPVGEMNLANKTYCIGRGLAALTIQKIDQRYGFYALSIEKRQLNRLAQGSTFLAVSKNDIDRIQITYPEAKEEQHCIAEILSTCDRAIEASEKLIAKEKQIKKGLMNDLLTHGIDEAGRIRTPQTHRYKESELGMIPEGWNCEQLFAVIPEVKYGISTSLSDEKEGIPVLRMNNLKNGTFLVDDLKYATTQEAHSLQLEVDDILFNRTNSLEHVGRTSIWKNQLPKASYASYLVKLNIDKQKIVPDFIVAWFNLDLIQNKMRNYGTPGVQQVNINPTNLRKLWIAYPLTLDEQCRIADVLTAQDKKIETEEANLAKLGTLKKGLMDDLLSGKVRVKA